MRAILHVDMDAFYASIEQRDDPALRGRPVIVGGTGGRGVVAAASYEVRRFGVRSAMPMRRALALCPDAVCVRPRIQHYRTVSQQIFDVFHVYTPLVEGLSLDEAFLDVTASRELHGDAVAIALALKARIRATTGLTASVGVAANKLVAKIASDLDKPDGLTVLTEAELKNRIWPLPVRSLPGIGPVTAERLVAMGVTTIRQLARLPLADLVKEFGPAHGELLYLSSRGIDRRPVVTHREPKSHSRERTFQVDIGDPEVLASVIATLAREVSDDLRKDSYQGRTVAVKVRFSNFETHTREKTLDQPTDSSDLIRQTAFDCLRRVALNKKVRLIGIRVGGLEKSRFQ